MRITVRTLKCSHCSLPRGWGVPRNSRRYSKVFYSFLWLLVTSFDVWVEPNKVSNMLPHRAFKSCLFESIRKRSDHSKSYGATSFVIIDEYYIANWREYGKLYRNSNLRCNISHSLLYDCCPVCLQVSSLKGYTHRRKTSSWLPILRHLGTRANWKVFKLTSYLEETNTCGRFFFSFFNFPSGGPKRKKKKKNDAFFFFFFRNASQRFCFSLFLEATVFLCFSVFSLPMGTLWVANVFLTFFHVFSLLFLVCQMAYYRGVFVGFRPVLDL